MLPMLLLILQIIGAIPAIIEAIKYLWNLINKLDDPKRRRELRRDLRGLVMSHIDEPNKKLLGAEDLAQKLHTMTVDVSLEVQSDLSRTAEPHLVALRCVIPQEALP